MKLIKFLRELWAASDPKAPAKTEDKQEYKDPYMEIYADPNVPMTRDEVLYWRRGREK